MVEIDVLPDFPKSKADVLRVVMRRIATLEKEQHPVLAQIKTFTQHEGVTMDFEQVGFGRKTQDAEAHAVSVELQFDEIPSLIGEKLEKKMRLLAEQSGALKMKSLFAKVDEATGQTGQRLNAEGKPLDGRMLLDVIDMAEGAFDKAGRPTNSFIVHPDNLPSLQKASEEVENDPNSSEDSIPSTGENFNSGLIGRIVENWLTSATERGYQIAFCQLLASEGEELLYIATHGPFEKGKDVITRSPDNSIRAYQLKGGDIRLADWRGISEQINNLVELPVNLPQCPTGAQHLPFFVTNGRIEDVVLDYINNANLGWRQRRFPHPLAAIEKSQLVHRFVAIHGAYLPQEASDFQLFLTLLLRDGAAPLDKPSFSRFIQGVISFGDGSTNKNVSRSLSSAVLLTSYILGSADTRNNHWALFEGWTVMASYILAAATKFALTKDLWQSSFDLAMLGANRALNGLVEECKGSEQFIEGLPMADGFFYGSRQLILAGLLSAWALARRMAKLEPDHHIQKLIVARVREAFIWGESAAPFVLLAALELEQQCLQPSSERFVFDYLQLLLMCHSEGHRGFPDSFISVEDSVRFIHQIGEQGVESFHGFSYTCQVAVDYLARRWRRRELALLWEGITRLSLDSSVPRNTWEWFFWKSDSAVLESSMAGQPESWATLVNDAENRDASVLPPLLQEYPEFALFFSLVFPHRLTPTTFAAIDKPF